MRLREADHERARENGVGEEGCRRSWEKRAEASGGGHHEPSLPRMRVQVLIQLVSHVLPPSAEKACS